MLFAVLTTLWWTQKFRGIQGGVLHCTPTVTLSECPWTISRYLQELHYGYKP